MKKVRYNDKLWFGKHSGNRVCELIKGDPVYIQKIIKEGVITLDDKSQKYFDEIMGGGGRSRPRNPFDEDRVVREVIQREYVTCGIFERPDNMKAALSSLVANLGLHYPTSLLVTVINNFYAKVERLNLLNVELKFKIVKPTENLAHLMLYVLNINDEEIAVFTL